jgi:hypothetical protein
VDTNWTDGEELEFQPVVHVPGYRFRTLIPIDDVLYDPHVVDWIEPDGRTAICDVGGQGRHTEFDPELGHGAIWWLTRDNRLEPAVPWGHTHLGMPMFPRLAPPSFGRWAGHALMLCQVHPGRRGAHWDHVVHIWDRRSDQLTLFAIPPRNDSASGDGMACALIPGGFGPEGTEHEGAYYFAALGNNSIYRILGNGQAETVAIMDGVKGPKLLPRVMCFGSDNAFPEQKGKLIVGGVPEAVFDIGDDNKGRFVGQESAFYIVDGGKLQDRPFATGNRMLAMPQRFGSDFGPLSGRLVYSDHGSINQSQSIYDHSPLPHDARLQFRGEDGELHDLVTGLRSGRNDILFAGDRLIISHWGKSYSTGEFHHPDGAIWELRWEG